MLHIFSLEYNPLLCGFVQASFCKCYLFFNCFIKEQIHLPGTDDLIRKWKLSVSRTTLILFLFNSFPFSSCQTHNIMDYAHRWWTGIKSPFFCVTDSFTLYIQWSVFLLMYPWIGKKFMTVLLKRLMEVTSIFLPSGRFLGTKNEIGKCPVVMMHLKKIPKNFQLFHFRNFDWFQLLQKSDSYKGILTRFKQVKMWN